MTKQARQVLSCLTNWGSYAGAGPIKIFQCKILLHNGIRSVKSVTWPFLTSLISLFQQSKLELFYRIASSWHQSSQAIQLGEATKPLFPLICLFFTRNTSRKKVFHADGRSQTEGNFTNRAITNWASHISEFSWWNCYQAVYFKTLWRYLWEILLRNLDKLAFFHNSNWNNYYAWASQLSAKIRNYGSQQFYNKSLLKSK